MVIRRAEGCDPREILARRGHRAAAAASAERLVEAEEVAVAVHQHHRLAERDGLLLERIAQLRIAARLLRSAAGEWRELGKDIRLLDDHDGAAAGGLCRGKAIAQPGDIGGVACCELGIAFGRAAAAVVAAYDVQRNEGDVRHAPARVLGIAGLAGERDRALSKAAFSAEKHSAQCAEALERRQVRPTLAGVAVGPLVVAPRIDHGMPEAPEPAEPPGP